jgi:hypothetical protein
MISISMYMKRFILLIAFLVMIIRPALAQKDTLVTFPLDPVSKIITYQEVVYEPGTKEELFNRCASWLVTFFPNPYQVTKIRDESTGVIRGQPQYMVYDTDENGIKKEAALIIFNIKIEMKDNRYRYTIDNFVVKKASRYPIENWLNKKDPQYDARWDSYLHQVDTYVREELIKSLKEKMIPEVKIEEKKW